MVIYGLKLYNKNLNTDIIRGLKKSFIKNKGC